MPVIEVGLLVATIVIAKHLDDENEFKNKTKAINKDLLNKLNMVPEDKLISTRWLNLSN